MSHRTVANLISKIEERSHKVAPEQPYAYSSGYFQSIIESLAGFLTDEQRDTFIKIHLETLEAAERMDHIAEIIG